MLKTFLKDTPINMGRWSQSLPAVARPAAVTFQGIARWKGPLAQNQLTTELLLSGPLGPSAKLVFMKGGSALSTSCFEYVMYSGKCVPIYNLIV